MSNAIESIILAWLALMTLRGILASSGVFPRGKKYSWLIYGSYDVDLMKDTLKQAGINEYDSRLVDRVMNDAGVTRQDIANTVIQKRMNPKSEKIGIENLIEIISRYIIHQATGVQYGKKRTIKTSYYICTVEASQDEEYLNWMCTLLVSLVTDAIQRGELARVPDFVLTPKGGNVFLGREFAERLNIPFLTSKFSLKSPYAPTRTGDSEFDIKTNFEGSWQLFEKQRTTEDGTLCGIVVDCNTSTGEQITDSIEYLNELARNTSLPLTPISHAFTLYRSADDSDGGIDEMMKTKGIRLHRYFDLSEEHKKAIYKAKGEKEKLDVFSDLATIKGILAKIPVKE